MKDKKDREVENKGKTKGKLIHKGTENLIPQSKKSPEERKRIARMGGKASGKAKREKKLISQIYAEFLLKNHKILKSELDKYGTIKYTEKTLSGTELLNEVAKQVLLREDSASVSMLKEMREATEGSKVDLSGDMKIIYLDKQDNDL
jgi:hypothetical protein